MRQDPSVVQISVGQVEAEIVAVVGPHVVVGVRAKCSLPFLFPTVPRDLQTSRELSCNLFGNIL